jgi:hypothetical protein
MREEWTVRGNFTSCLSSTASQLRKSPLWATAPKSSREASGAVNGDRFGVAESQQVRTDWQVLQVGAGPLNNIDRTSVALQRNLRIRLARGRSTENLEVTQQDS